MKFIFVLLLSSVISLTAAGTSTNGSASSVPIEVKWQIPTNSWSDQLWIYKVVPQNFAPAVINNLLTLCGFTEKDKTKVPSFLIENDKATIFYGELEGKSKHLTICPTLGYIDYLDPKAEASSQLQMVQNVPNEKVTMQLGLKHLRLLGIDVSQIARKSDGGELALHLEKNTFTYFDKTNKLEISKTNSFGVLFNRSIDGIGVGGVGLWGGVKISFGNNAKVRQMQVCWRNLEPYELKNCLSLQEIAEQIRIGKIILYHLGTKTAYPTKLLQKLTITRATPFYDGKYMDEPMDYVSPHAKFQGVADDGKTTNSVWFECLLVK
jgi:hypothetical protein